MFFIGFYLLGINSLCSLFPQSSALKTQNLNLQIQSSLICHSGFVFIRDHGGIQTPDRWSRNPVLYSAELRGRFILL